MFLGTLHLRTNQKKIEDDKNNDEELREGDLEGEMQALHALARHQFWNEQPLFECQALYRLEEFSGQFRHGWR